MDTAKISALSPTEQAAWIAEQHAYDEALTQRGLLRSAEALQPVHTAVTVRNEAGHVSVSEGASTQTSAQLDAVYGLDARDLNEAVRIASNMPSASLGCIEIRPIDE